MAKTMFMGRHTDGNVYTCIYEGTNGTGANDLIVNPLNRINDVLFHSNFAYLKSNVAYTATITLPIRSPGSSSSKKKGRTVAVPAYGSADYTISTADVVSSGVAPNLLAIDSGTNRTITGTMVIQQVNSDNTRYVSVSANSSGIFLTEQYVTYSASLPAITLYLKVYVIKDSAEITDAGRAVRIEPTVVKIAEGVFNSDLGYVKVKSGVSLGGSASSYVETSNSYFEENGSLRRVWKYRVKTSTGTALNEANIGWDAFERYDGTKEGLWAEIIGDITEWYNASDGWTYKRGAQVEDNHDYSYTYDMWYLKKYTTGANAGQYLNPALETSWTFVKSYNRGSRLGIEDIDWKGTPDSAHLAYSYGPPSALARSGSTYGAANGSDFVNVIGRPFQCVATTGVNIGRPFAYQLRGIIDNGTLTRSFQIYRTRTVPVNTGRAGAAFVNGPTLNIVNTPGGVSTGLAFYYDGIQNNYGDIVGYPSNTLFGAAFV